MSTSEETRDLADHQVPISDRIIETFEAEGRPWVVMKPVSEAIGVSWQGQQKKLEAEWDRFNCQLMLTVGADGKLREILCIPLDRYPAWLFTINPNKISDLEIRARIIKFQEISIVALYQFWFDGSTSRESVAAALSPDAVTALTETTIKTSRGVVEAFGKIKDDLIRCMRSLIEKPMRMGFETTRRDMRLFHLEQVGLTQQIMNRLQDIEAERRAVAMLNHRSVTRPDHRITMRRWLQQLEGRFPPELCTTDVASELSHHAKTWFPEHGHLCFPPGGGSNRIAYEYDTAGMIKWWDDQGKIVFDRYWSARDKKIAKRCEGSLAANLP
jgi:hypothetical protein